MSTSSAGNTLFMLRIMKNGQPIAYQDSGAGTSVASFKRAGVPHIGVFAPGDTLSFQAYISSTNAPVTIPLLAAGFAKLG